MSLRKQDGSGQRVASRRTSKWELDGSGSTPHPPPHKLNTLGREEGQHLPCWLSLPLCDPDMPSLLLNRTVCQGLSLSDRKLTLCPCLSTSKAGAGAGLDTFGKYGCVQHYVRVSLLQL